MKTYKNGMGMQEQRGPMFGGGKNVLPRKVYPSFPLAESVYIGTRELDSSISVCAISIRNGGLFVCGKGLPILQCA